MSVLSGTEVSKYCSSFKKINPNGVDVAPKEVRQISAYAKIFIKGDDRGYVDSLSEGGLTDSKELVLPDETEFYEFHQNGLYEMRFPKVTIPADCMGLAFPRSTINRLGIIKLESAVFDSGYSGEFTQSFFFPLRARIHKDEALVQLVFFRNEAPSEILYHGRYQNESV